MQGRKRREGGKKERAQLSGENSHASQKITQNVITHFACFDLIFFGVCESLCCNFCSVCLRH